MPKQIKDLAPTASLELLDMLALQKNVGEAVERTSVQALQQAVFYVIASSGASQTIDLAHGSNQQITLDQASVTITLPTVPAAGVFRSLLLALYQDNGGSRNVTWAITGGGNPIWADTDNNGVGDIPPINLTATALTLYHFIGTSSGWIGGIIHGGGIQNATFASLVLTEGISGGILDYSLDDLNNVAISGATDKDILFYDAIAGNFVNGLPQDAGLAAQGATYRTLPVSVWSVDGYDATKAAGALTARAAAGGIIDGTRPLIAKRDFITDSNRRFMNHWLKLPKIWNLSTISARVIWTAASGTGNVVFGMTATDFGDNQSFDTATLGTERTVTDNFLGADKIHTTNFISSISDSNNNSVDDLLYLQLFRDNPHASDTFTGTVEVLAVEISFTTNKANDA